MVFYVDASFLGKVRRLRSINQPVQVPRGTEVLAGHIILRSTKYVMYVVLSNNFTIHSCVAQSCHVDCSSINLVLQNITLYSAFTTYLVLDCITIASYCEFLC